MRFIRCIDGSLKKQLIKRIHECALKLQSASCTATLTARHGTQFSKLYILYNIAGIIGPPGFLPSTSKIIYNLNNYNY